MMVKNTKTDDMRITARTQQEKQRKILIERFSVTTMVAKDRTILCILLKMHGTFNKYMYMNYEQMREHIQTSTNIIFCIEL